MSIPCRTDFNQTTYLKVENSAKATLRLSPIGSLYVFTMILCSCNTLNEQNGIKMDKRSSLFCLSVSDEEKKFYIIDDRRKILNVNVVAASLCAQGPIL